MPSPNYIHPKSIPGKSLILDCIQSLPAEAISVAGVCGHSPSYRMQNYEEQPVFCGLCLMKEGFEAELPSRLHAYKQLASNGNPETETKFLTHLTLVMGYLPPKTGESLASYRFRTGRQKRNRKPPRAREQYSEAWLQGDPLSKPSSKLYPVASALWKLMGYQPPLGIVLVKAVSGRTEQQIARELDISILNVYNRMGKGIRTAMGYLPKSEV